MPAVDELKEVVHEWIDRVSFRVQRIRPVRLEAAVADRDETS